MLIIKFCTRINIHRIVSYYFLKVFGFKIPTFSNTPFFSSHSRLNFLLKFRLTDFYILNLPLGRILTFGNIIYPPVKGFYYSSKKIIGL